MKTLYLIRHAKSSWDFPELSDFDRPLHKRGLRDAPLMGRILHQKGVKADLILSSPAKRALLTAHYFADGLGVPLTKIKSDERLYEMDSDKILAAIREVKKSVDHLLVFGHNPALTHLANDLCTESIDNIVTAAVFSIQFKTETWKSIGKNNSRFKFYEYPKKYYSSV